MPTRNILPFDSGLTSTDPPATNKNNKHIHGMSLNKKGVTVSLIFISSLMQSVLTINKKVIEVCSSFNSRVCESSNICTMTLQPLQFKLIHRHVWINNIPVLPMPDKLRKNSNRMGITTAKSKSLFSYLQKSSKVSNLGAYTTTFFFNKRAL